ncbi:MAG: YibE/F family protein [Cutibacterium granulosum]|nr:YibE/F family protein [Cutibacterium granulosum]
MWQVLTSEQFAAEIIRTLVGSIGLVLAVPLTTAVAVASVPRRVVKSRDVV